ncbi:MAG TPA: hypothetical protein VK926_03505 [Gaiellaceae bacterium]|nr:hypothetical protein [Gaiellaceae bacterium]
MGELSALVVRPSRADEPDRLEPQIGWIRQRIESIVQTLKDPLWLEHHMAKTAAGRPLDTHPRPHRPALRHHPPHLAARQAVA